MIIFRTSPETIQEVIRLSKHALASIPKIDPGELILISQTINSRDKMPPIRYIMEFVRIYQDITGESEKIWGRHWKYIVDGRNCRPLKEPFNIQKYQISNKNYAQGGPIVYVTPEDEHTLRHLGLLKTL